MLAEKGKLDVNDPVAKYFSKKNPPEFKVINPYDTEKGAEAVTLESLSSQTSGLPADVFNSLDAEDVVMEKVNEVPLYHEPLTRPHYSNIGFSLLGHCCERAAKNFDGNMTYEQWLKENVFTPLEMNSTGFDYPEDIKKRMAGGCK